MHIWNLKINMKNPFRKSWQFNELIYLVPEKCSVCCWLLIPNKTEYTSASPSLKETASSLTIDVNELKSQKTSYWQHIVLILMKSQFKLQIFFANSQCAVKYLPHDTHFR